MNSNVHEVKHEVDASKMEKIENKENPTGKDIEKDVRDVCRGGVHSE